MAQLTVPVTSVVPLQDCAVVPDPMVKVTTLAGSGVSVIGVFVVNVPDNVAGCPFTSEVGPVYVTVLESGVTVNVLVEESEPIGADDVVASPEKDAVSV
jgi:tetrahydromethanopterin S-methyltransferase subunit D